MKTHQINSKKYMKTNLLGFEIIGKCTKLIVENIGKRTFLVLKLYENAPN